MKKILGLALCSWLSALGSLFAANELTLVGSINYTSGFDSDQRSLTLQVTVTNQVRGAGSITISTNNNPLTLGTVTSPGYLYIRNLDATNSVQFGPATNSFFGKLKSGEFAIFRLSSSNVWSQATGGNVICEYRLWSE